MTNRYFWLAILTGLLIFFQYRLWIPDSSMRSLFTLKKNLQQKVEANKNARERNERLYTEIKQLKNNREMVESEARTQLGMIKKNETFYQIVDHTNIKQRKKDSS